ncbi:GNAT family N-acetyltransferase [Methanobacterium sp. ACI-7]|uniref:GNAT family N-acetyltransferase n=1 Tax=unclassified Methanobacterium TaxID=2627676 RepID=UPI0039C11172
MNISYCELNRDQIDLIKPLWDKLRDYHSEISPHFSKTYAGIEFEDRRGEILKKSANGTLRIDIVKDEDNDCYIGYCISSISEENVGEVDSIFLEEEYRSSGIGNQLMTRALKWMDEKSVKSKKIVVSVGNEELFSFYQKFDFLPRHIILEQK